MPAIIALLLRQVIMSVATGAVVTGAQEYLNGTIKELVFEIKDKTGVTEKDAWDVANNILADLAVNSAAILLTLKTKIAVTFAEALGLTSRGLAKKTLTKAAAAGAAKLSLDGGKLVATSVFKKIATIAAVPASGIWLVSALANIIEPGIYKPEQTNALYKKLGIPFQYPITGGALKPGSFSTESFRDYASGLETAGVTAIKDPFKTQSVPYSRENLADIVNFVYGQEVLKGNAPSANKLIPLLSPYIVKSGATKGGTVAPADASGGNTTVPTVKVFTGIVSQGVVGKGLVFTPRPDDLIESVEELRTAAANNLAPFLAALPGKIVYEVKVVSSVISKDGFRQTGTTQRIKTGTYANGTPKYKTVTNKFATLVLYALTDKGTRTKLSTIVLGPTDSAKITVAQNDLQALQNELPSLVTTTDINEIKGIETTTPVVITTPADKFEKTASVTIRNQEDLEKYKALGYDIRSDKSNHSIALGYAPISGTTPTTTSGQKAPDDPSNKYNTDTGQLNPNYIDPGNTSAPATVPSATPAGTSANNAGANALTLYEWYQARGQTLPSVSARAVTYEGLGLGPRSYYTGTAEQNTKLLNALKST